MTSLVLLLLDLGELVIAFVFGSLCHDALDDPRVEVDEADKVTGVEQRRELDVAELEGLEVVLQDFESVSKRVLIVQTRGGSLRAQAVEFGCDQALQRRDCRARQVGQEGELEEGQHALRRRLLSVDLVLQHLRLEVVSVRAHRFENHGAHGLMAGLKSGKLGLLKLKADLLLGVVVASHQELQRVSGSFVGGGTFLQSS